MADAAAGAAGATSAIVDIEDLIKERAFDACACPKCASLCHGIPGIYDPDHLERLLDGGLPLDDLVKECVIDYYAASEVDSGERLIRPIFYLRPRLKDEKGGVTVPMIPTVSSCARLTSTGCGLARDEMPIGCISGYGCRAEEGIDKQNVPELWDNTKGRDLIKRFEGAAARIHQKYIPCNRAWEAEQYAVGRFGMLSFMMMQISMLGVEENRQAAEDRHKAEAAASSGAAKD